MEYLHKLYSPEGLRELVHTGGYLLLCAIVFAETGLLIGFFLPGDSLLVTVGVLAGLPGNPLGLSIGLLILLLSLAAIAGDNTGYWFGRKAGGPLFARPDSRLFKRKHLLSAQKFYEEHGAKTIVLARFVPIVRTFGPIVAGAAGMLYRRFLPFSIAGGIAWISSMTLLGYLLGSRVPGIEKRIDKLVLLIIAVSLLPIVLHRLKERRAHRADVAGEAASDASR